MTMWGRKYSPLANAIAIEVDPQKDNTNYNKLDENYHKTGSYGHLAIVKPTAAGGTVEHKATSWIPGRDAMMTGTSRNDTLGYDPGNPPSTQTMRVKWTKQTDGNYRFSYEYWFAGDTKDIPNAIVYQGSQTYTEAEALEMFGGREVYFGIYASSDKGDEKWETNFAGFVDLRQYKVGYNYNKKTLQDDGTYTAGTPTEVLVSLMEPKRGEGLNGTVTVPLAPLADIFTAYVTPTATLDNNPYTPLKQPELKPAGQNYLNPHSFTAFDATN